MTSNQILTHTISEQLNEDNTNHALSKKGIWLVFCQHHSLSKSYHARTDWLQYPTKLVT